MSTLPDKFDHLLNLFLHHSRFGHNLSKFEIDTRQERPPGFGVEDGLGGIGMTTVILKHVHFRRTPTVVVVLGSDRINK
jgi:hypothetical protein